MILIQVWVMTIISDDCWTKLIEVIVSHAQPVQLRLPSLTFACSFALFDLLIVAAYRLRGAELITVADKQGCRFSVIVRYGDTVIQ